MVDNGQSYHHLYIYIQIGLRCCWDINKYKFIEIASKLCYNLPIILPECVHWHPYRGTDVLAVMQSQMLLDLLLWLAPVNLCEGCADEYTGYGVSCVAQMWPSSVASVATTWKSCFASIHTHTPTQTQFIRGYRTMDGEQYKYLFEKIQYFKSTLIWNALRDRIKWWQLQIELENGNLGRCKNTSMDGEWAYDSNA